MTARRGGLFARPRRSGGAFGLSAAFSAVALTLAGAALAQSPLPSATISPEDRARFRLCRAAVFVHLDGDAETGALVTREAAQAMREQFAFIMSETLSTAPRGSVAEGQRMIDFAEGFFLSFSRTIVENRAALDDVEAREKLLIECQPMLWSVVRERIDYLMAWRERAVAAPPVERPFDGR